LCIAAIVLPKAPGSLVILSECSGSTLWSDTVILSRPAAARRLAYSISAAFTPFDWISTVRNPSALA